LKIDDYLKGGLKRNGREINQPIEIKQNMKITDKNNAITRHSF
jgi:hypothetical protein